jgi:hypothetical protein
MQAKVEKQRNTRDFEDPKIILTASLLKQRDNIVTLINASSNYNALKAMATLIAQFDIEAERTDLLDARDELIANTIKSTIPPSKVMHYFQLINEYLNITYFADFHKAKPKFATEGHI